jgi:hypothetical protein
MFPTQVLSFLIQLVYLRIVVQSAVHSSAFFPHAPPETSFITRSKWCHTQKLAFFNAVGIGKQTCVQHKHLRKSIGALHNLLNSADELSNPSWTSVDDCLYYIYPHILHEFKSRYLVRYPIYWFPDLISIFWLVWVAICSVISFKINVSKIKKKIQFRKPIPHTINQTFTEATN